MLASEGDPGGGSSTKLEQANASLEQSRQQARAYQARHKALKAQNLPYVAPIVGSLKGIVLVDKSKRVCDDRDTRGHYEGPSLVLLRSGQFVKLDESGEWSNWQDESSHWVNEVTEISDLDAIHQFGFAEIIKGMVEAFQDAKKKAEKKKGQLGSRLTQLTQIEMILKEEKQC